MKHLIRTLFAVAAFCQLSCSDDEKIGPEEMQDNITLEFISEEVSSGTVAIENFTLLSVEEQDNDGEKYYNFEYSFEIHNSGSVTLELNDWMVQNYLILDPLQHAASGTMLYDVSIAPGEKYLLAYSANSTQLENGLEVDGMTLQINVRQGGTSFIKLEYLIHVED